MQNETRSDMKYCGNCTNFKKGTEKHDRSDLSSLNSESKDTDRCRHTEYKINEYTFCIVSKHFSPKQ